MNDGKRRMLVTGLLIGLCMVLLLPTAVQADAASTTAFLMGSERGARFVQQTDGAYFVFLSCADGLGSSEDPAHRLEGSRNEIEIQSSPGITGLAMSAENWLKSSPRNVQ